MQPRSNPFLQYSAALVLSIAFNGMVHAGQVTWDGSDNTNLLDANNWVGGLAPIGGTDGILFGAPGAFGTSLVLDSNIQYTNAGGAIVYGASAPTYTISGTGLITVGTGSMVNNSGVLQVINNNLKRNTGNAITIGANGGILEFNGTYDIAASSLTSGMFSFGSTVGGVIAFNGGLVNTGVGGTYGLTMPAGSGMVVLGGTNTAINGSVALGGGSTLKLITAGAVNTGQNISTPNSSNDTLWLASNTAVNSFNIASGTSLSNKHNVILGTGSSGTAVTNQQVGTFAITSQNGYYFSKAGNVVSGTPTATFTGTASFGNTATTGGAGRSHIVSANGVNLIFSAATAFDYNASTYPGALVLEGDTTGSNITGKIIDSGVASLVLTKAGGGTFALAAGGDYDFQVLDASGAAGTGYDTVSLINGASLGLTALTTGSYAINLLSLASIGPDGAGNALNFNNTQDFSWPLFSTGSSLLSAFQASNFTINRTAFSNAPGGGTFSIGLADSDTDIVLNFTAVPEPRAALPGSLGLLALLRRRR